MIEDPNTKIEENDEAHSDILYALLTAINLNIAVQQMHKAQDAGKEPDEQTMQAIFTSTQVPTVIALSAALCLTVRPLLVDKTIDFDTQFEIMWNNHPLIHKQLEKEQCKNFFIGALDIESNSIILNSS